MNVFDGLISRLNTADKRNNELGGRSIKFFQTKMHIEKRMKKICRTFKDSYIKRYNLRVIRTPEREQGENRA